MDQMAVDIDDRGPVIAGFDHVIIPYLFVQCARIGGHNGSLRGSVFKRCLNPISGGFRKLASSSVKTMRFVMEINTILR